MPQQRHTKMPMTEKATAASIETKVPPPLWVPTVIQGTAQDPDNGRTYLVLMVELPCNINSTAMLHVKVTADGRFIEVLRPRGDIVSNMGYAEKVMMMDGGKHINPANVRLFVGALNKPLWDLRGMKKSGIIYDTAKISLLEPANPTKKPVIKLMQANGDGTCGILVILQTQRSEEVMSDDDTDDGRLVTVLSPIKKKKRNIASI
jgi:hypothetical protein